MNLRFAGMHAPDAEHPLSDESSSRGLSCMTRRHMLLHGRDEQDMTPERLINYTFPHAVSLSALASDRATRESARVPTPLETSVVPSWHFASRTRQSSLHSSTSASPSQEVTRPVAVPPTRGQFRHAPRRWPAVSRSVSSLVSSPARRLEGRGLESEPEPMGEPLEDLREPLAVLMREAIIMQSAAINGNQHAIRAPELQHLPRESCPQPGRGVGPAGRGFRQAVGRLVDGRAC